MVLMVVVFALRSGHKKKSGDGVEETDDSGDDEVKGKTSYRKILLMVLLSGCVDHCARRSKC